MTVTTLSHILPTVHSHRVPVLLFCLGVIVQLIYFSLLPVSLSIDSYGYIALARNPLGDTGIAVRTLGYPLLVAATGVPWLDSTVLLVIAQMVLGAALPIIFYSTLLPSGRSGAIVAAVCALVYPYPHVMSLQVMSELPYIFALALVVALFSRYVERSEPVRLAALLLSVIVAAEVRPSANLVYVAVVVMLLALAIARKNRQVALHAALAACVTFAMIGGRSLLTERNSGNLAPFFMWHWVSRCELVDGRSCISTDNGPRTHELFAQVHALLSRQQDMFNSLASDRDARGGLTGVRPEFRVYSAETIALLVDDLQHNTAKNLHRGPGMVFWMWNEIGMARTGTLLRGAIFEAFTRHPQILRQLAGQFVTVAALPRNVVDFDGRTALHDNVYWWFVPSSLRERGLLAAFPGGERLYAEWLNGLLQRTGQDAAAHREFGRIPETLPEARAALALGNVSAVGLFTGSRLTRWFVKYTLPVSIIAMLLAFATRQWAVAAVAFLAGWGLMLSGFAIQMYYRQLSMHLPLLFFVVGAGVSGAVHLSGMASPRRAPGTPPERDPRREPSSRESDSD